MTARMDLVNGSIDHARFAPANQLFPNYPDPVKGMKWLPGETGQGETSTGGEELSTVPPPSGFW